MHQADSDLPAEADNLQSIEVTGTAIHEPGHPAVDRQHREKGIGGADTSLCVQDALRNVPGITLNAGEGGAHGDSVNLRGLSIPDSFFLDGMRDIGHYQRDTFDEEAISRAAWVRHRRCSAAGSTAGRHQQSSSSRMLTPLAAMQPVRRAQRAWRGTADFNLPDRRPRAARVNLMDQRYRRRRARPRALPELRQLPRRLAFGIDTPTSRR